MAVEENFFKLLKYSNELKKNKKYLEEEDPKTFDTLLNFLVKIAENIHYSEKEEYINLAKDFLDNEITAEDFSYSFLAIYEGISKKINQMKIEESTELVNFLKRTDCDELNELLARIYGACDSFSIDPEITLSDENELKECAEKLLLKLQNE